MLHIEDAAECRSTQTTGCVIVRGHASVIGCTLLQGAIIEDCARVSGILLRKGRIGGNAHITKQKHVMTVEKIFSVLDPVVLTLYTEPHAEVSFGTYVGFWYGDEGGSDFEDALKSSLKSLSNSEKVLTALHHFKKRNRKRLR